MVNVASRRNRNFSVRCSVAALITLSIALLVVLLASPATAVSSTFQKNGSKGVQCIGFKNSICSGSGSGISHKTSLELEKCYTFKEAGSQKEMNVKVVSILPRKFGYRICPGCGKCNPKTEFMPYGECYIDMNNGEHPFCSAKPA
eukprot:Nk52_evm1s1823 gene=Nk52_evmTU1s1823